MTKIMRVFFTTLQFALVIGQMQMQSVSANSHGNGDSNGNNMRLINSHSAGIAADSKAGLDLLSKSQRQRVLEGGEGGEGGGEGGEGEGDKNHNDNNEVDASWMQGYSIKFLGCHHIATWNDNADEAEDVRIKTERVVRYRVCPYSSCADKNTMGCTSGYGDYVVNMDTFLQAYLANKKDLDQQACENLFYSCNCQSYYGEEYQCQYKCATDNKMTQCINQNNNYGYSYGTSYSQPNVDLSAYTYCTEFNGEYQQQQEGGDKDRTLEQNNNNQQQQQQQQQQYFLGPYCADRGDEIRFGMFTDDACTNFADSVGGATEYYKAFGSEIPYKGKSLVDKSCYSCKNIDYDNGGQVETKEMCENIYAPAGKCESNLSSYAVNYPNQNACSFIDGIKVVKHTKSGVIYQPYHGSRSAAIWIAIFATTFVLLAFYVCHLKSSINNALMARSSSGRSQADKKSFIQKIMSLLSPKNMKKKFSFNRSSRRSGRNAALI